MICNDEADHLAAMLPRTLWTARREADLARLRPWALERLDRMSRREKHPVRDFLFEYYSFRPAHLLRWSPGMNVPLAEATAADLGWAEFTPCDGGMVLLPTAFVPRRLTYLRWAVGYLAATAAREPSFACFGLHEWAMVYRDSNIRHSAVPLRLGRTETESVLESQPLRCTHYDAFRFFTPEAVPLNRFPLSRESTTEHDQPGCIHATMDLYRFAYKIGPFCPTSLLADAFELARTAREVDMRASPYDLSAFGYTPLRIESRDGREEYVEHQRELFRRAMPIRERMLATYREVLAAVIDLFGDNTPSP